MLKLRLALYVVLGVLVYAAIVKLSRPSFDDTLFEQQTANMLHAGRSYHAARTRDSVAIAHLKGRSDFLVSLADSLRDSRDTVRLPAVVPPACQLYADLTSSCQRETVALRGAIAAKDSALTVSDSSGHRSDVRADSLAQLLTVRPKECRIPLLGVRCPRVGVGVALESDMSLQPALTLSIDIF